MRHRQGRRSAQAAAQARTHGLWPAATQSAIFNGLHHRNPWTTTDPGGMEDWVGLVGWPEMVDQKSEDTVLHAARNFTYSDQIYTKFGTYQGNFILETKSQFISTSFRKKFSEPPAKSKLPF